MSDGPIVTDLPDVDLDSLSLDAAREMVRQSEFYLEAIERSLDSMLHRASVLAGLTITVTASVGKAAADAYNVNHIEEAYAYVLITTYLCVVVFMLLMAVKPAGHCPKGIRSEPWFSGGRLSYQPGKVLLFVGRMNEGSIQKGMYYLEKRDFYLTNSIRLLAAFPIVVVVSLLLFM